MSQSELSAAGSAAERLLYGGPRTTAASPATQRVLHARVLPLVAPVAIPQLDLFYKETSAAARMASSETALTNARLATRLALSALDSSALTAWPAILATSTSRRALSVASLAR